MNNIRYLIFDLDGTLLNDKGLISPLTKSFLLQCQNKYEIILISGRCISRMKMFANELNIIQKSNSFIIGLGGNDIFYPDVNKHLTLKTFTKEQQKHILASPEFKSHIIYGYSSKSTFIYKDKISFVDWIKNIVKFFIRKRDFVVSKKHINRNILKFQSFEVLSCSDSINTLADVFVNVNELEILPKGINKLTSLLQLNIRKNEAIYFGDSENDLPCIKYFDFGVAMKNSVDELKKVAKFTTKKTNNEEGIFYFLNKECSHNG